MTVRDALKSLSAYPVPVQVLDCICTTRGVDAERPLDEEAVAEQGYILARADVLLWLADAPNVSQGGQSYTLSQDQRDRLRAEAYSVLQPDYKPIYGYKGSVL